MENKILSTIFSLIIIHSACKIQSHVQKDPNVDMGKYRTYAWLDERDTRSNNGKPYRNFEESFLISRVSSELEKAGWKKSNSNPDALIDFDIMVESEVRNESQPVYSQPYVRYVYNPYTRRISTIWSPSQYVGQSVYQVPYKSGTITVNIVDNESKNLVWQGWAETDLTTKNLNADDIDKIVDAIFKKFPNEN